MPSRVCQTSSASILEPLVNQIVAAPRTLSLEPVEIGFLLTTLRETVGALVGLPAGKLLASRPGVAGALSLIVDVGVAGIDGLAASEIGGTCPAELRLARIRYKPSAPIIKRTIKPAKTATLTTTRFFGRRALSRTLR